MSNDGPDEVEGNSNIDDAALREFIAEQVSENPLVRDVLSQARLGQWVEESLFADHPEAALNIVQTILTITYVSQPEAEYYVENNEECAEIYERVLEDFEAGTVSDDLVEIHRANGVPVLEKIEDLIETRRQEIFGETYEEIREVERSDRDNKDEILERIKRPFKDNPANEDLWTEIKQLRGSKNRVQSFPYSESDIERGTGAISGDEHGMEKHFAVRIWRPELYTLVHKFEEEYDEFPLKWLVNIPVSEHRILYRSWQESGNVSEEYLVDEVNGEGYLDGFFKMTQKLPFFQEREKIIREIVDNFSDERYASVINLVLPQIEAFIWIYAAYLQQYKDEEILLNTDYDNFWGFNPREHENLSLRNTAGNEITTPRVKDLVSETVLVDYLNPNVVEYFVDTLFMERSPILHGNVADYHSELEAAKKIIFLRNLVDRVTEDVTRTFAERIQETVQFEDDYSPFVNQTDEE